MKNRKGFTLIELMIVVAIIGILAAIAIPNFLKFQAKSKQSEAKTNLKGIYTAETGYFGENNSYGTFNAANWEPVGKARYRYTLGTAAEDKGDMTLTVQAGQWTLNGGAAPAQVANAFTAGAQGNVDSDTDYDAWEINDANVLLNAFNDV